MTKRTRLKLTWAAFFALLGMAVLKHFLPGMSLEIIGIATTTVLGYLWVETKRPSQ